MNRCKDCKHLGEEIVLSWRAPPEDRTGYHKCLYLKHAGQDGDLYQHTANAAVIDGSGYFAALVVKDDFGCVNFQPKG